MTPKFRKAVSDFFLEYVNPAERGLLADGKLTDSALIAAVRLLLKEQVFEDFAELKLVALRDANIILPDWLRGQETI